MIIGGIRIVRCIISVIILPPLRRILAYMKGPRK